MWWETNNQVRLLGATWPRTVCDKSTKRRQKMIGDRDEKRYFCHREKMSNNNDQWAESCRQRETQWHQRNVKNCEDNLAVHQAHSNPTWTSQSSARKGKSRVTMEKGCDEYRRGVTNWSLTKDFSFLEREWLRRNWQRKTSSKLSSAKPSLLKMRKLGLNAYWLMISILNLNSVEKPFGINLAILQKRLLLA